MIFFIKKNALWVIGVWVFSCLFVYNAHAQVVPRAIIASTTTITSTSTIPTKIVALTFDDGPYGTTTAQILSILEEKKVTATFFLIGQNVLKYPSLVKREVKNNFLIGNHSFSHSPDLAIMSSSTLRADILKAQNAIYKASGKKPNLFRPPYGSTTPEMIKEINNEGYTLIGWNLDPNDWDNNHSSTTLVATVMGRMMPKTIVLLHDGHEVGTDYSRANIIAALPTIIDGLKNEGYQFVTLDKVLGIDGYRK